MNKKLNTILFAYNFPHRKTNDFINILYRNGHKISLIIASNRIKINSPKSRFDFKKYENKETLQQLVNKYNIPLYIAKHNSVKAQMLIKKYKVNFGIIAGARIIKRNIINSIKYGILNFHPGLLPSIRGLDSILWSIYFNQSIGVTVHLISEKIDSGHLVHQEKIKISSDDDIYSLYEKNYQLQLKLVPISLNLILKKQNFNPFRQDGRYNKKMLYSKQLKIIEIIDEYVKRQSFI